MDPKSGGRLYDVFFRLFFLDDHRENGVVDREWIEESDQFRFLRVTSLVVILGKSYFLKTLPKRHMMCVHFFRFTGFSVYLFSPLDLVFFILLSSNHHC